MALLALDAEKAGMQGIESAQARPRGPMPQARLKAAIQQHRPLHEITALIEGLFTAHVRTDTDTDALQQTLLGALQDTRADPRLAERLCAWLLARLERACAGATQRLELRDDLAEALVALCRAQGVDDGFRHRNRRLRILPGDEVVVCYHARLVAKLRCMETGCRTNRRFWKIK